MSLPEHSPLGASGASRWMVCPGSAYISKGVVDEESEYAALGTAAHALAATCLHGISGRQPDAWEFIGGEIRSSFGNLVIDKDMADAVQMYIGAVRKADDMFGKTFIEARFHCPEIHELFYGTVDYAKLSSRARKLDVWDYKHGAGVVVDVKNNVQAMYYACGILTDLKAWDDVDTVALHIAQPRGFHPDGPIRDWSISSEDLKAWMNDELVPAMNKALISQETKSGDHCRFCPARSRQCPQLMKDMDELEKLMEEANKTPQGVSALTNEQVGRFLTLFKLAKIVNTAALKTGMARANAGHGIPGWKLAQARSNRTWSDKDKALEELTERYGDAAFTEPSLLSPAAIDKLPQGKSFTTRLAHKPDAGLTLVPETDSRRGVSKDTKSMFTDTTKEKRNG